MIDPLQFKKIKRRQFITNLMKMAGVVVVLKPRLLNRFAEKALGEAADNLSPPLLHPTAVKALTPGKLIPVKQNPKQILSFHNTHTGETLKRIIVTTDGYFNTECQEDINSLFRDFRRNESIEIDPKLLMFIAQISNNLGTVGTINLVSGYRSQKTNEDLRKASFGIAKGSYHTKGMAADIFIDGVSNKDLQRAALALKKGGVGHYPHFVHIDTGRVRRWGMLPKGC
jgi:uncharacterized protein YcbK (DUF882 family)